MECYIIQAWSFLGKKKGFSLVSAFHVQCHHCNEQIPKESMSIQRDEALLDP